MSDIEADQGSQKEIKYLTKKGDKAETKYVPANEGYSTREKINIDYYLKNEILSEFKFNEDPLLSKNNSRKRISILEAANLEVSERYYQIINNESENY